MTGTAGGDRAQAQGGELDEAALLTGLTDTPVLGCTLGHVSLLRLDRIDALAPGNKVFKLQENLAEARARGVRRLVSFGGAWSNHLHALAAVAHQQEFESVGLIRGGERETAMLVDARRWGMQLVRVSREQYRRRYEEAFVAELEQRYAPCVVIPEGGANDAGVRGCRSIADLVNRLAPEFNRIVLPVGTGTTLAGLVAGLDRQVEVVGIASLKGALDLEERICTMVERQMAEVSCDWRVLHDYHCGGYARVTRRLREFIESFESAQGVPLEPVYTGKMLHAIHHLTDSGRWERRPLLAIHTGGLQGRRGYDW